MDVLLFNLSSDFCFPGLKSLEIRCGTVDRLSVEPYFLSKGPGILSLRKLAEMGVRVSFVTVFPEIFSSTLSACSSVYLLSLSFG